jgi:choline-sulfatase
VALTDLFGIATSAAGKPEFRQGIDVLGMVESSAQPRQDLFGYYGEPGTPLFKIMVRNGPWKYIYLANGGREQLFHLHQDPHELSNVLTAQPDIARQLRATATRAGERPELREAMDGNGLRAFEFHARELKRIYQFDRSRGITGFPKRPQDGLLS